MDSSVQSCRFVTRTLVSTVCRLSRLALLMISRPSVSNSSAKGTTRGAMMQEKREARRAGREPRAQAKHTSCGCEQWKCGSEAGRRRYEQEAPSQIQLAREGP